MAGFTGQIFPTPKTAHMRRKMGVWFLLFLFIVAAYLSVPANSQTFEASSFKLCGEADGLIAFAGDKLRDREGKIYRLAGIKTPELWEGATRYSSWPHAKVSRDALAKLVEGHSVTFYCEPRARDRHNALIAHVIRDDGLWLKRFLLEAGHAIYFPLPDSKTGLQELLAAERKAREKEAGLWALAPYKTLNAHNVSNLMNHLGRFSIVTGHVEEVTQVGDTVFINFGENWRRDFTIEVNKKTLALFEDQERPLYSFRGQSVEVRGFLDRKAGPRILLLSPDHLRSIEPSINLEVGKPH